MFRQAEPMALIPRFYLPQSLTVGAWIALPDAAAQHMRVLRLKVGDSLSLFNGAGGAFSATVRAMDKKQIQVEITAYDSQAGRAAELPYWITFAQAIAGGGKMDWLIEKAVELGVECIVPLMTARSVVQLADARAARRRAHWQAISSAACRQCGRYRVPEIAPPMVFLAWLDTLTPPDATASNPCVSTRFLLSPAASCGFESLPLTSPADPVTILVGPESGLDDAEEQAAIKRGFIAIHLGPRILRTETAGLAMLAALAARWKGWHQPSARKNPCSGGA